MHSLRRPNGPILRLPYGLNIQPWPEKMVPEGTYERSRLLGSLEYRNCRKLADMQSWDLRHLWCDGFSPERYYLTGQKPYITGGAWICLGQRQSEWKFTLLLPPTGNLQDGIDLHSLLPPENMARRLTIDQEREHIKVEPGVAMPDLK